MAIEDFYQKMLTQDIFLLFFVCACKRSVTVLIEQVVPLHHFFDVAWVYAILIVIWQHIKEISFQIVFRAFMTDSLPSTFLFADLLEYISQRDFLGQSVYSDLREQTHIMSCAHAKGFSVNKRLG